MVKKLHHRKTGIVRFIGVFKLLKAAALLALGLGALKFLHRDIASEIQRWLQHFQVDPENHYLRTVVSKVTRINNNSLVLMSIGTFFYAALFLVEGIGLLLLKRWAEIFTVIVTSSFIPLEIYHLVRQVSPIKIAVIIVNAAIVVYLLWRLINERKKARG